MKTDNPSGFRPLKIKPARTVRLPHLFIKTINSNTVAYKATVDGLILSPVTDKTVETIYINCHKEITISPAAFRLYHFPDIMEVEYINGEPDRLLLKPKKLKCIHCGSHANLHNIFNGEIYICNACLNKAFDLRLPDDADNSI